MWCTQTSPFSTRANESRRLTLPMRRLLTSVPVKEMPVSIRSRMWYSWNARRFSAIVRPLAFVVAMLLPRNARPA
ncbi:hypothetical protein D3C72_2123900 [compost metagenome]